MTAGYREIAKFSRGILSINSNDCLGRQYHTCYQLILLEIYFADRIRSPVVETSTFTFEALLTLINVAEP